jgi:hypothetical protein
MVRFLLHGLATITILHALIALDIVLPPILLQLLVRLTIAAVRATPPTISIPLAISLLLIYLYPIPPANQALGRHLATLAQWIETLHHYLPGTRNGRDDDADRHADHDRVIDNLPSEAAT